MPFLPRPPAPPAPSAARPRPTPAAWTDRPHDAGRDLLALALACTVAGIALHGRPLDGAWLLALQRDAGGWAATASVLAVLGLGTSLLVLAGLVGLRWPRLPAAVLLAAVVGGLGAQALKPLFDAARPAVAPRTEAASPEGTSFKLRPAPSGHAAAVGAVAAILLLALPAGWPHARRRTAGLAIAVCASACLLARVAVGAHWPSSVLLGTGLGLATGVAAMASRTGRAAVDGLAAGLRGRTGSRLFAALLVGLAGTLWVADHHDAVAAVLYPALAGLAMLAAVGWWRVHRGLRLARPRWMRPRRAAAPAAATP